MKWNEIERIVHENQIEFDDQEPSSGHFARFENILQKKQVKNERSYIFKIAAAVAFLIVSSSALMYTYMHLKVNSKPHVLITQDVIEFGETEAFYKTQVKLGMDQIEKLQLPEKQQKETILSELTAMDENYKQLKLELDSNPADERVIHAIIDHYQVKIEAINQIINSVSYSQLQLNQKSHGQNI